MPLEDVPSAVLLEAL
jgi:hypothetical protein